MGVAAESGLCGRLASRGRASGEERQRTVASTLLAVGEQSCRGERLGHDRAAGGDDHAVVGFSRVAKTEAASENVGAEALLAEACRSLP